MKKVLGLVCLLLLAAALGGAEETTCPAHRAAEHGFSPFEAFHHVVAPAWHDAWPDKDYDALIAAGPEFLEAYKGIAELEPEFKSTLRYEQFHENRARLGRIVKEYAAAAEAGDKEKVYELMPQLHDAFEYAAGSLLPVSYPEFEGIVITLNLILETHLPKNNTDGITGSTETLLAKFEHINAETLPEELRENEQQVIARLHSMAAIAQKMKKCCDDQDMDGYREQASTLNTQVEAFIADFI